MLCSFVSDVLDGGLEHHGDMVSRRRLLAHTWSATRCALNSVSLSAELCVDHFAWRGWDGVGKECGRVMGWVSVEVGKRLVVEVRGWRGGERKRE